MQHGVRSFFLLLVGLLLFSTQSRAQLSPRGEHVVRVVDWPASLIDSGLASDETLDELYHSDVLPFIDSLTVAYHHFEQEDLPMITYRITWYPGEGGIYQGREVGPEVMPEHVEMMALDLHAEVYVGGQYVDDLLLTFEDLALGASPASFRHEADGLRWGTVFNEASDEEARAYFARGFTLANLEIARIAFAEYEAPHKEITVGTRPPINTTVIRPGIRVGWAFPAGIFRPPPRKPTTATKRPENMGRGTRGTTIDRSRDPDRKPTTTRTGRTSTSGSKENDRSKKKNEDTASKDDGTQSKSKPSKEKKTSGRQDKDDDDDDDATMLPAAVMGAVAVGAVAYAAGTIGYYNNIGAKSPIGLLAGYVKSGGGVVIHGAINTAVLNESTEEPERLTAGLTLFYNLFGMSLQPAVGFGATVTEYKGAFETEPTLLAGLAANLGSVVLLGTYNVLAGGAQFGVAFNFRR